MNQLANVGKQLKLNMARGKRNMYHFKGLTLPLEGKSLPCSCRTWAGPHEDCGEDALPVAQSAPVPVGVHTFHDQDLVSPLEGQVVTSLRCETVKSFAPFCRKTVLLFQIRSLVRNVRFYLRLISAKLKKWWKKKLRGHKISKPEGHFKSLNTLCHY